MFPSSFFWKKLLVRTGLVRWLPSCKRFCAGAENYLHYFSDRVLAAPLQELLDPAWFPATETADAINLALGSPRCELPFGAIRGLNDRRAPSPWGLLELRQDIAAAWTDHDPPYLDASDEILVTHGATGAFAAAIDAFIMPGSKVVLFDPTSPIFPLGLKHRRAQIRWVQTWLEEGKTRFDIEDFGAALRGARLLVMADPVNPTGGVFAPEDLEQIAWWAKKYDVLIYLDRSFDQFRYDGATPRLENFPSTANRLLIAGSASKSHGLGAARVGWLLGCKHLLRPCALMASLVAPHVAPICQHLVLNALTSGRASASLIRDEFAGRRRYLFENLTALGFKPGWPAGGFFFWIPVDHLGMTGREFARRLYAAQRVLVNPGEPFGPSGEDCVRLSYATEEGRLREGMERLAEFVEAESLARFGTAISDTPPVSEKTYQSL